MCLSRSIHGYVLLIVLIFLQILSCLGLYELTSAADILRLNYHRWLKESASLKAGHILTDIEQTVLNGIINCIIPITVSDELIKKPLDWWQSQGCYRFSSNIHYYYVVEFLENDSCAVMGKDINNQSITADYYRITLFVKLDNSKLILQSTLAKPSPVHLSCSDNPHMVLAGRQMIREL